jgi:hypothetical protein
MELVDTQGNIADRYDHETGGLSIIDGNIALFCYR